MANKVQDFIKTTSLHGLAEIYHAQSSVARLYWSLIFGVMITSGTYFIYTVVDSYVEAPITSLVSTVDVKSMELPEVAICYTGAIDTAKLLTSGLSKQAVRAMYKQFAFGRASTDTVVLSEGAEWFKAVKPEILEFVAKLNITGFDGLILYASFNCSQLIQEYYHSGENYAANYPCNLLKTIPHYYYGTCYILPSVQQTDPVVPGGWKMLLKAPLEDDIVLDLRYLRSFAIEIGKQYDLTTFDAYNVPLNRTVSIVLQQTTYKRLKYRQWPRSGTTRCHKRPMNGTYMDCSSYCYAKQALKRCNCSPFYTSKVIGIDTNTILENRSVCWPDFEYECANTAVWDGSVFAACLDVCLPLCDETVYGVVISYADFGAEQTITELGLAGSTQGVINVQIGFNALRYTRIEEQDIAGLDGCISNVGGMFGLWLGGSVFTIIHLLTTLCGWCTQKSLTNITHGVDRSLCTRQIAEQETTSIKK